MTSSFDIGVNPLQHKSESRVTQVASSVPDINLTIDTLPSKSLSYPNGSVITYRPYTYGEVKYITQSKLSAKQNLEYVMKGITSSFDLLDLTVADLLYIGLLRKISTLGSTQLTVPYTCPACHTPNKLDFKTKDLEFEDLEIPELPLIADFSVGEIEFMPLTVGGYFKLLEMKKEDDSLYCLAIQSNKPVEEAYKLFYGLQPQDGQLLEQVDKMLYHGIMPMKNTCRNTECKHVTSLELDGGEHLVLPFRQDKKPTESRIRFGSKAAHKSN